MKSRIVLVSGAPGAGKTTVAGPLARALRFALIGKDHIKETLQDALAPEGAVPLAESRRIGGASMHLLWALAATCPDVVLEANFRPHSTYEQERLAALDAHVVEVYCWCPPEVAAARFAARAQRPDHHRTHALTELSPQMLAEFDRPFGVGDVRVDTTAAVDTEQLAERVRALFA
ncbi:MAG TPA: AAA family ATPase [Mycobacteriales bacterium]|nr:AAA family ATPase [Mycobacteriales bacterium]